MDSTLIGIIVSAVVAVSGYIFHLKTAKDKANMRAQDAIGELEVSKANEGLIEAKKEADLAEEEYNEARRELIAYFNNGKPRDGE